MTRTPHARHKPYLVQVCLETKGCTQCGTQGVPGGDWQVIVFFLYHGAILEVFIEFIMHINDSVFNGMLATDARNGILATLCNNLEWMRQNRSTAKR